MQSCIAMPMLSIQGSLKVPVRELLSWLIDEDTLEIPGKIEEVNEIMLERFLKQEEYAIVLFYDEEKRDVREMRDVFKSLEAVDDKLDKVFQVSCQNCNETILFKT